MLAMRIKYLGSTDAQTSDRHDQYDLECLHLATEIPDLLLVEVADQSLEAMTEPARIIVRDRLLKANYSSKYELVHQVIGLYSSFARTEKDLSLLEKMAVLPKQAVYEPKLELKIASIRCLAVILSYLKEGDRSDIFGEICKFLQPQYERSIQLAAANSLRLINWKLDESEREKVQKYLTNRNF
jgi:hypothetical protein